MRVRGLAQRFFAGEDGLLDKRVYGHWAYATRYRGVCSDPIQQWVQFDIANTTGVIASIDDDSAIFHPISSYEFWSSHSTYDDIGLANVIGEILRA